MTLPRLWIPTLLTSITFTKWMHIHNITSCGPTTQLWQHTMANHLITHTNLREGHSMCYLIGEPIYTENTELATGSTTTSESLHEGRQIRKPKCKSPKERRRTNLWLEQLGKPLLHLNITLLNSLIHAVTRPQDIQQRHSLSAKSLGGPIENVGCVLQER